MHSFVGFDYNVECVPSVGRSGGIPSFWRDILGEIDFLVIN